MVTVGPTVHSILINTLIFRLTISLLSGHLSAKRVYVNRMTVLGLFVCCFFVVVFFGVFFFVFFFCCLVFFLFVCSSFVCLFVLLLIFFLCCCCFLF